MKKKILFILLFTFMLTGCTVDYKLTIDKDMRVTETTKAIESEKFFENYEKSSIGRVVGFLVEPYLDKLNDSGYETKNYVLSKSGGVILTKEFNSLEDYKLKSLILNQFTDDLVITKKDSIVTIHAKGVVHNNEQDQTKFAINNGNINIEVPFKVSKHNADSVNGNLYTWNIKADEEKDIMIVFNKDKLNKKSNYIEIIATIGVIIIVSIVICAVFKKIRNRKEEVNKI